MTSFETKYEADIHGKLEGLICILSQVEACYSFNVRGNRSTHKLEIKHEFRKCLHYYFP